MDDRVLRVTAVLTVAGLLVAGCGDGNDTASVSSPPPPAAAPPPATSPPSAEPGQPPSPAPAPAKSATFQVWFLREGKLFQATRTGEQATTAVAARALQAVAAGPSTAETGAGVKSVVPAGTRFKVTGIADGLASVEADDAFRAGGEADRRLREAQVVYTLTQYQTIKRVRFATTANVVTRKTYEDLLPAIVVAAPQIGQRIGNPVKISGTANVFEATVSMRILDSRGKELAKGFTTATCGTGCRGDYTTTMRYSVSEDQPGVIEVYESSAEDGSRIHVVDIPVTLTKAT